MALLICVTKPTRKNKFWNSLFLTAPFGVLFLYQESRESFYQYYDKFKNIYIVFLKLTNMRILFILLVGVGSLIFSGCSSTSDLTKGGSSAGTPPAGLTALTAIDPAAAQLLINQFHNDHSSFDVVWTQFKVTDLSLLATAANIKFRFVFAGLPSGGGGYTPGLLLETVADNGTGGKNYQFYKTSDICADATCSIQPAETLETSTRIDQENVGSLISMDPGKAFRHIHHFWNHAKVPHSSQTPYTSPYSEYDATSLLTVLRNSGQSDVKLFLSSTRSLNRYAQAIAQIINPVMLGMTVPSLGLRIQIDPIFAYLSGSALCPPPDSNCDCFFN